MELKQKKEFNWANVTWYNKLGCGVTFILFGLIVYFSVTEEKKEDNNPDKGMMEIVAHNNVKAMMNDESSASFISTNVIKIENNKYKVYGTVSGKNAFNATIKNNYSVVLVPINSTDFEVLSVNFK